MKKFTLISLMLAVVLLAACEGDNPSDPGTLNTVQGLAIDGASAGTSIVLTWTASTETIDGYEVYFKTEGAGSWLALGTVTGTTYTDDASVAGTYSVRAYEGTNFSENYATEVSTMPNIISTQYTIYDNYATGTFHSGIIFGASSATTGLASDPEFEQDIYAYDNDKGDETIAFQSGKYGTWPNGNETYMYDPDGTYGHCPEYGTGTWYQNYNLYSGDNVVFGCMPFTDYNIYIKIYIDDIFPETTENGTGVILHYEYQTLHDVSVFTNNS